MHIQTALQKGHFHPVFCEDFLLTYELSSSLQIAAVMDGCTMGDDSHFASTLLGKILKKVLKELSYEAFAGAFLPLEKIPLEDLGKAIFERVFHSLNEVSNSLLLEEIELMSTMVLAIVNTDQNCGWVMVVGDGYIGVNEEIIDVDQNNKPDYIGYHIGKDFQSWWNVQNQKWNFSGITELVIASDGPGAIRKMETKKPDYEADIIEYLLVGNDFAELPRGMNKKLEHLESEYGLVATDDVAIVAMRW